MFLASNLLWIAWGLYAQAYALILLQVCLAAMNCAAPIATKRHRTAPDGRQRKRPP